VYVFGDIVDCSFSITLRLDWNDMDANGDPTLDADIYHNGKKYCADRTKWHHTPKKIENGEWIYDFEFETIKLRFKVGITSRRNQQATARIASPVAPCADGISS
jgi:hypothetical protein